LIAITHDQGISQNTAVYNPSMLTAASIIEKLQLQPHPEGGHYRETWRAPTDGGRSAGTAIFYLLEAGQRSNWHKIDATEIWHYYAGAALELSTAWDVRPKDWPRGPSTVILGPDLENNQWPQRIVHPNQWQSARSLGDFSLVGCTVAPGFEFEHFELAPPGWEPS
jgi:predicted cupin superfamily sugar epimerase